jgi:uncharacterized membrane protein YebE (DUF533 family)
MRALIAIKAVVTEERALGHLESWEAQRIMQQVDDLLIMSPNAAADRTRRGFPT